MDQHRWDDEADDQKPAPKGERPSNEGGFEDDDSQLKFFGSGGQRSGPPRPQGGGYGPRDDRGGYQRRDDRGGPGGGYQRRDDRGGQGGGYQRRDDRGGYQPRDDRGGYQRRDDRGGYSGGGGGYQRRDDRGGYSGGGGGGYQRRDDRGGYTPRDDRGGAGGGGGYQRRDDRGGYTPRDDRGGYQRRDDRGGYTPRDDRGGSGGGYQRRDDRGGYGQRDDRGGYQRRDDRGGYTPRDDRGGSGGGGYQRRDDRGGYGDRGGYQRRDDRGGYGQRDDRGGYGRRDDRGGYGRRDDRGRTFRSRSGGAPDEQGRRRFDPNRRQRVDRDAPRDDRGARQGDESPLTKRGPGTTLVKAMVSYQFGSRMLALKAIEAGRVTVNDNPTSQPNTFIRLDRDVITVDHEELLRKSVRPIYIVFHKPMGLIGSKEEFRRNLYSYLTNKRGWSVPIGVLPRAASGIVIVTNDRIHRAADDSSLTNLLREYQIKVHRAPKKTEITKLQKALRELWKGHESSTEVELARTTARAAWIAVRSTTGSLHDITTTLHAMGLEPLRIERTRVGPFSTEDLAAGAWYRLSAAEVDTLNAFSKEAQPASSSAAQSLWQQVKSRLFDVDAED